jgi:iron complex outermembrane recepter protein
MSYKNLVLILPLITSSINAETNIQTKEIIIKKYQYDTQEGLSPYSVEIHSAKEIGLSGSTNLTDYLAQHSSLNIVPNYGDKSKPMIDMRGYGAEAGYQNVVISIDGQRLNNIDMSPQLLGSIDLSSIDRIEIVKGSGSVRYGDGAMGGVIQIYTKDYSGYSIETAIGSSNAVKKIVNAGFNGKNFNLSVNVTDDIHKGFADVDINGERDRNKNKSQTAKLKFTPSKDLLLNFGLSSSRVNLYRTGALTKDEFHANPAQNSGNAYSNYDTDSDKYSTGLEYKASEKLNLKADFYYEEKLYNATRAYGSLYSKDYMGTNISAEYQEDNYTITTGIDYFDAERVDQTNRGTTTKDNLAIFVESQLQPDWLPKNIALSAGLRHERVEYTHSDSAANYSTDESLNAWDIGINYEVDSQLSFFGNYNHAYQAPDIDRSFVAVWQSNSPYAFLRRDFNGFIEPSKVDTLNAGFNHITQKNKLKIVAFYSDLKDEIVYNPTSGKNENIDNSEKYGLEIHDNYKFNDRSNINFIYKYIEAKIGKDSHAEFQDGRSMPGVPNNSILVNLSHKVTDQMRFNLSHTWKEDAYIFDDFLNESPVRQPAYISTDVSVNYEVKKKFTQFKKLRIYGSVSNIFEHSNAVQSYANTIYPFNFSRVFTGGLKIDF